MSSDPCPACGLTCDAQFFFCPRCGAGLGMDTGPEQIERACSRLRMMLRNRAWHALSDDFELAQKLFDAHPELRSHCESFWTRLGQDVQLKVWVYFATEFPRVRAVAQSALKLFSAAVFPALHSRVLGLTVLTDSLTETEKQYHASGAPAAEAAESWFRDVAGKAGFDEEDARSCVFANIERWPTVAAALDPAAFAEARLARAAGQGELDLEDMNFGSARKRFSAVVAEDQFNARALAGMARTCQQMGKTAEAIAYYREAHKGAARFIKITGNKKNTRQLYADMTNAHFAVIEAMEEDHIKGSKMTTKMMENACGRRTPAEFNEN